MLSNPKKLTDWTSAAIAITAVFNPTQKPIGERMPFVIKVDGSKNYSAIACRRGMEVVPHFSSRAPPLHI